MPTNCSPITDALSLNGIRYFSEGFIQSYLNGYNYLDARKCMSYASMLVGICLANAGLGTVHEDDFDKIINRTSNKFNHVALSHEDLYCILKKRL